MSQGFIRYEKKGNAEYATHIKAIRDGGAIKSELIAYLGRVVDKEKNVYRNRARGTFTYDIESGFGIPDKELPLDTRFVKLCVDFGDCWLLNALLERSGLKPMLTGLLSGQGDTLFSMLFYRVLGSNCAGKHTLTWWEGSYARLLFPKAEIGSHQVTTFNRAFGDESIRRNFFKAYLPFVSAKSTGGVLIDSTGLPNKIDSPLTALNVHNGEVNVEARLIFVLDKDTKLPLYCRYVAGNIVDVTTLQTTLAELAAYGVSVKHAIIDAGYYSEANIRDLQKSEIPYVIRMKPNYTIYKDIFASHRENLEDIENAVKYRDRILYIKRVAIDAYGKTAYAYLSLDVDARNDKFKTYMRDTLGDDKITNAEREQKISKMGVFALLSSVPVETSEILPLYYMRQAIEQVFDISKNYGELLPLRVHSEEALRGHLLLSFIASSLIVYANQELEGSKYSIIDALLNMRNLKCQVFDKMNIVLEPNKKMNDIAKHLKLSIPKTV